MERLHDFKSYPPFVGAFAAMGILAGNVKRRECILLQDSKRTMHVCMFATTLRWNLFRVRPKLGPSSQYFICHPFYWLS